VRAIIDLSKSSRTELSAANQSDDFQAVVFGQLTFSVSRPWDEFQVSLDRDELRPHSEFFQQIGDRRAGSDFASFVVHRNLHRDLSFRNTVRPADFNSLSRPLKR
jgi:hypothetical protein